ncbi:PorV/PorQ family protein, partial [bacterium]
MMKKLNKKMNILTTLLFILFMSVSIIYADDSGTTAFQFLKMDVSARAISMGGAFTAVADDVSAVRYNPAGIRLLLHPQLAATHMEWLADLKGEYLVFAKPLKNGAAMGASIFYMGSYNDWEGRDQYGNKTGDIGYEQGYASFCYAKRMDRYDNYMAGINVKYVYESLDYKRDSAIAFDVGMLGRLYRKVLIGASIRNIGIGSERFPIETRLGLSYLYKSLGL